MMYCEKIHLLITRAGGFVVATIVCITRSFVSRFRFFGLWLTHPIRLHSEMISRGLAPHFVSSSILRTNQKSRCKLYSNIFITGNQLSILKQLSSDHHSTNHPQKLSGQLFSTQAHRSASHYRNIPQNCISHHRDDNRFRGTISQRCTAINP